MKPHKYFFTLSLLLCVSAAFAQKDLYEKQVKRNTQIVVEIESLRKDSLSKHLQKDSLDKYCQMLASSIDSMKGVIRNNEDCIKDGVSTITKEVADLHNQINSLQDSLNILQKELAGMKTAADSLNEAITGEEGQKYADILSRDVFNQEFNQDEAYLNCRFSVMNIDTLRAMQQRANKYAAVVSQKDYDAYLSCLKTTLKHKTLYDEGVQAISSPFQGKSYFVSLRKKTIPLITKNKGAAPLRGVQFSEMDSLDISLSRYSGAMDNFRKIINKINTDLEVRRRRENKTNDSELKERIYSLLPKRDDNFYKIYVMLLPYIQQLLERYKQEIEKDPYNTPNSVEKEIM